MQNVLCIIYGFANLLQKVWKQMNEYGANSKWSIMEYIFNHSAIPITAHTREDLSTLYGKIVLIRFRYKIVLIRMEANECSD